MDVSQLNFQPGVIRHSLPSDEVTDLIVQLPGWRKRQPGPDAPAELEAVFSFDNFVQALAFTHRVGEMAESFNHHPAILLEYGRVTVRWWTHTAGGITVNDLVLARETSQLVTDP